MKTWPKNRNILISILILLIAGVILFFIGNYRESQNRFAEKQKIAEEKLFKTQKAFESAPIFAKTFSVYDATDQKEVYNKSGNEILPLASLTKIMTVLAVLDKHTTSDIVVVTKNSPEENLNGNLIVGEKWTVGELAKFTLITSSNDGALTLSGEDKNLLREMNKKAGSIGMEKTTFLNFTGLDFGGNLAGSYGTALDVNLLALYALENYPEIFHATVFSDTVFKSESGDAHFIKNTNLIIDKIPNLLFSKTGWTTQAGGNLVVIFKAKNGHTIAITLLGSTQDGRFEDMEKLVEIAYNLDYGDGN